MRSTSGRALYSEHLARDPGIDRSRVNKAFSLHQNFFFFFYSPVMVLVSNCAALSDDVGDTATSPDVTHPPVETLVQKYTELLLIEMATFTQRTDHRSKVPANGMPALVMCPCGMCSTF